MKVIAPILLLAAAACAQDLGNVPECGRTCVNNMFEKAKELGCSDDDFKCLCDNADFGNGLRDCTLEACPEGQLEPVQSAAADMCPNSGGGGSASSSGGSGGDEPTQSPTDSVIPSATGTDGSGSPTATGSETSATGSQSGSQSGGSPSSTLATQSASGTDTGGAPKPTKTGGNGGGGAGGGSGNDDNSSETGGNGSGSKPTETGGNGGSGAGGSGSDPTGTDSGDGASETGAAQALAIPAGGMVGALGLAAILAL